MPFTFTAARFTDKSPRRTAVVFAENKTRLTEEAAVLDAALDGAITRGLKGTRFQGGMGEIAVVNTDGRQTDTVVVVGTGRTAGLQGKDWWNLGLAVGQRLDALGTKEACICLGGLGGKAGSATAGTMLAEGMAMALYRFDQYKSEQKPHQTGRFEKLTILTTTRTARDLEEAWPKTEALLLATARARDCGNLPPNVANPQFMADEAKKLEKLGCKVEVLDENDMARLGLNLFLAVGGNAAPGDQPRLILIHYNGGGKDAAPVALVGKGVMFDTGGYNIKTGPHMKGMKFDMCGSAAVLGAMEAIARRKPKINVIGVLACAMNMVGDQAFLPDSIYKSYKGLFVEIGNTDAEGRLVLADAIAYTIDKHNPSQLIDLATLTGAVMVALGGAYAGLFSTSDTLAKKLEKSGNDVGERLWRLPLDDCFKAKTEVADVNNDGSPYGGSSVGAAFIGNFVGNTPWAHLDIAGVAWPEKGAPGVPAALKGATGFGTRLLVNFVEGEVGHPQVAPKKGKPGRKPAKNGAKKAAAKKPAAKRTRKAA